MAKMAVGITTPPKASKAQALKDGGHGGAARGFHGHDGNPPILKPSDGGVGFNHGFT